MQQSSTSLPSTSNSPSHMAYHVSEEIGGKAVWKQIGIVWPHRDRKGSTIYVNRLPVNGRIVLREASEGAW